MMMNQSRPPAAAKNPGTLHHTTSSTASSAPSVDEDSLVVKLLIYDDSLTEEEVNTYFEQFGELLKATKIQKGKPNSANVQFKYPSHAFRACQQSRCIIQGVHVTVLSHNATESGHTPSPTENLVTLEFTCKPLALEDVQKEILKEFTNQRMVQVDIRMNTLVVHVDKTIADLVKEQIKSVISSHESKIETTDVSLEFYYLPVLADLDIQRAIHSIKLPSQVRISRGAQKVELGELAAHYENRSKGASELATLNQYLTPSAMEGGDKYQWYWCDDDDTLQPYTEQVSDQIEKKFVAYHNWTLEITIRRQPYTIDSLNMTQTNTKTQRLREIKRVDSSDLFIKLHITAHKTITSKLVKELRNILSKSIEKKEVPTPTILASAHTFITTLLDKAQRNYIQAYFTQHKIITLQGQKHLTENITKEIRAEIKEMKEKIDESTKPSVPDCWEPQSDKCELKIVSKDSAEWNEISDKILKPKIVKIERIQNTWLWETYQTSEKRLSNKNDSVTNEKMLFHGSSKIEPKKIYNSEQGFDYRLAAPGLYGKGSYFAVEFRYSHKYAYKLSDHEHHLTDHTSHTTGRTPHTAGRTSHTTGHISHTAGHTYQLFLVKVITGISCECSEYENKKLLRAPPEKSECPSHSQNLKFEGERFDSVCGNSDGCKIYVIYDLGRAYPAYLITYTI